MPKHDLARIRHGDIVQRLIRARRMDVQKLGQQQVTERFRRILSGYTTFMLPVQMNGIFRARKNPTGEPFRLASELWYPPEHVVLRRGRFNSPNTSLFYACNRANGAIFEIGPNVGDTVTLLIARTKDIFAELNCAHIGLEKCLAPELSITQKSRLPRSSKHFNAYLRSHGISKKWLLIDEFLSDIATTKFSMEEEENKYKLTNAIANLFFSIPNIDALNYPSIATKLKHINICMKPDVADAIFIPSEAWMIQIEEESDSLPGIIGEKDSVYYRITFLRRSEHIKKNGEIKWSTPLRNVSIDDIQHLVWNPKFSNENFS